MINLPEWLENELKTQYNDEIIEQIKQGFESERKTTFRVNTIKSNDQEIIEELEANQIKYKIINKNIVENVQTPTIFVLENDIEIRNTKIYNEGKIYIQNLSSMIPPLFLNPKEQEDILDMAAAPGGKTTQMAAMANNKANITACERNTIRLDKMLYNINKQGANIYCIKTQEKLLNKAIKLLKKDGELIYSTCSIFKKENDEIIQKVISQNPNIRLEKIDILNKENINMIKGIEEKTITILPNEYFEGFYIAKLVK